MAKLKVGQKRLPTRKEMMEVNQNAGIISSLGVLTAKEKVYVEELYKYNFNKIKAFDSIHEEDIASGKYKYSTSYKNNWWGELFRYKEKSINDYLDLIIATAYRSIHLSREEEALAIYDIARTAKEKGDLKLCLDAHKAICKMLGYLNDQTIYNIANIQPAVEIHYKEIDTLNNSNSLQVKINSGEDPIQE